MVAVNGCKDSTSIKSLGDERRETGDESLRDTAMMQQMCRELHALWLQQPDNSMLWDVKIVTDDGMEIHASKTCLAAQSLYFKHLFCQNAFPEGTKRTVVVRELSGVVMEGIVGSLLSCRPINFTVENVLEYLEAADRLQMQWLKAQCCAFMHEHRTPDNIIKFMAAAQTHNCGEFVAENEDLAADLLFDPKTIVSINDLNTIGKEALTKMLTCASPEFRQCPALFDWYSNLLEREDGIRAPWGAGAPDRAPAALCVGPEELMELADVDNASVGNLREMLTHQVVVNSSKECMRAFVDKVLARLDVVSQHVSYLDAENRRLSTELRRNVRKTRLSQTQLYVRG